MKIRINKRITLLLLLVFICIISIPSALSMYREKQTKTLKTTITHPNYTVTADANGGSIPATTGWTGTGATATKTVTYGHEYGTLPEPTRTGYTFKGWVNGIETELPLPSNYKQLDYIESTRTQYIDTGYIPKTTTKVELDLSFNGDFKNYNTYGGNGGFLGVIDNGARSFTINFGASSHESTILHSWFNKVFQYDGQGDEALIITDNIRTNRNKMTIENGRITYGTATRTISSKEYDQIDSMYIFGLHRNASVSSGYGQGAFTSYNMRVYDMKIYESDVLVRHYVPVIDKTTHKLGLYETVNGVFYSNETADEFETSYISSETVVNTSSNHTITAVWDPTDYEIQYDLQGGTLATSNPATYNIETDTFTLNNPTLTGYTFTGWTGSNGTTPQTSVTIAKGSSGDRAYIAHWQANSYTVTADANGGTIPSTTGWTGTGSTSTKSVTYNSPYGTLPTPTRDGYIFKGWNGKNLFNKDTTPYKSSHYIHGDGTEGSHGEFSIYQINVKPNTTYTITGNGGSINPGYVIYDSEGTRLAGENTNNRKVMTFTTPSSASYMRFSVVVSPSSYRYEKDIFQIEEGTTATPYEPYYVTSQTPVTQAKNHTLTAKWKLKEATFLPGTEFNAKIKQLAANEDATYQTADTNITSILRTNALPSGFTPTDDNIVSTSDSNTPIYAWFSNGTLYYYTDAVNFYMNNSATDMFYNLNNVTSIDITDINTSKTTSMNGLFHSCYKLSMLDVSNFNTSNVTTARSIFAYNRSLTSLDVSSFDLSSVNDMTYIFTGMTELKQLKTPKTYPVDSSITISLPKLMVDGSGNEYTKLDNTSPTETMLYTPATFLPGVEFNIKIKQLAGNSSPTTATADTNITNIVRTNTLSITPTNDNIVSTSDSNTPIYAWFDNGIIYYYSEAADLYLNSNANYMFMNLRGLTSLDIDTINTNKTTQMAYTFYNLVSLQSLNLSNFDTSNVSLMQGLFYGCNSLTSLDISTFDMDSVTNTNSIIGSMASLESLKTPNTYPSEAVIQLPKTLYDPSGNAWSVLDSSAPTETWLHKMVCKRATTLHTETCSQTSDSLYCSGAGYKVGGSKNTRTITYGSLGTNATTLNSGDAFTCDVNGDGTFNELTERFYYVGDYYNTTTKEFETDTGVLVYYNNVSEGTPSNTATSVYDSSGENWHGPVNAILRLPTTSQWSNVELKNNTRAILTYNTTNLTAGGTLPSDFSYSGYSARLLTLQEINHSLNRTLSDMHYRLDDIAPYLFENTQYSSPNLKIGWWLETTDHNSVSALRMMIGYESYYVNGIYPAPVSNSSGMGVRPAIEVNKNFLNKKVNAYLITYDTNGGSENTTQTVNVGDSLESLSVPTREGYTFNGWYTAASGGEEVTTATVPTATTTYYAHWTPINYNITYDLDGGEVGTANPTTYNPDSNSITLNNPTKTGYTFAGWNGGKNLFDENQITSEIITVEGVVAANSAWRLSDYIPVNSNTNYTFSYVNANSITFNQFKYVLYDENKQYISGEEFANYSTNYSENILTSQNAKYVRIAYSVVVNSENASRSNIQLEEGTTATSYEPYVSNETTLTIPSGSVGNRKYKANWTANTYTVKYNGNGNTGGSTANSSHTYDQEKALTTNGFTKTGYTFRGWSTSSTDTNLVYDNSEYSKDATLASIYINIVQYNIDAPFEEGEVYQLDFEAKGTGVLSTYFYGSGDYLKVANVTNSDGYSGTNPDGYNPVNLTNDYKHYSIRFTLGSSGDGNQVKYVLFRVFKENIGYVKNIRFNKVSSSSTAYVDGQIVKNLTATNEATLNLYALWDPTDYEITYDLQGGTLANSNPATYNIETNTFTLNNPTLTGQAFIGWTGSNGNTPEVNVTIPVGSYGDKAYVAHFSPIYEPETRIRSLNTIGTSIADDDPDSNLRYIGSNPNNYVSFNGQKWRIIGVFDGKLKIIGDSIGNYSWDTSRNTVNKGYGINQWGPSGTYTGADLMKLLNPGYSSNTDLKCNNTYSDGNCGTNDDSDYTTGLVNNSLYWNASSGYCYNYGNYKTTSCDFSTSGLQSDTTRNMIDNATWYLGGNLASDNIWDGRMTASYLYNIERSNNTGKQCSGGDYCNDDVTRITTWQGKVGLLYPSDYIYATGGGSTYNRNTCLTVHAGSVSDNNVSNWNNTYTDCKNNDWLLSSSWTWSLSPRALSSGSYGVFFVDAAGIVSNSNALNAGSVRPVVYLKSSIKFTTGDGSFNSPFNLIDTE